MTTMRTEYWRGHNLCEELAIAMTEIEANAESVPGSEFKPGFWNLYLILNAAAEKGFAVTQHIIEECDRFDIWDPSTDECVGPVDANGISAFMKGFAVAELRREQQKGDPDASE